jgi:hypothetical protein
MRFSLRSKLSILFSLLTIAAVVSGFAASGAFQEHASPAHAAAAPTRVDCSQGAAICTEVYDSETVFGEGNYVGHDEPSTLFYSNTPGSGNRMRYQLTLPKDPTTGANGVPKPGQTFNFELHPAFWFGMAMCDTQSFPEQVSTCTPDSDKNIVDPAVSPAHPGMAFMEMQFYPPGWAFFPQTGGISCDPTRWCAALNIDSLSENPVTGQFLNSTCANSILGGTEYINFAFITKSGHSQGPANPIQSVTSPTSLVPDPTKDLFMNSGDQIAITMHDTSNGLQIALQDKTTGQSGSMTASKANGFGQVQFAPTGTSCNLIPSNFHPMYSTSSEKTRVTWAAHSYNIAFADEIGHFDYCNGTIATTFPNGCTGTEGAGANTEPSDGDDFFCQPASNSLRIRVSGCTFTNQGFDGVPYQSSAWPDGNTALHPTAIKFTSPLTGSGYNVHYSRMAFEGDQPRIEAADVSSSPVVCDRNTGANCTIIPSTDDGNPASFYPFFSITNGNAGGSCAWQIGNHIPGSKNDFSQDQQYGTLLNLTYTGTGGGAITRYNDFRQVLSKNPC